MRKKIETLGELLKDYREKHGLNQVQLAKLLKISQGTISRIETGKQARIRPEVYQTLSKVLNKPLEYLMELPIVKDTTKKKEEAEETTLSLDSLLSDPDFIIHFSAYQDFKSLPEGEQKEALRRVLESYKKAVEAAKKMENKE